MTKDLEVVRQPEPDSFLVNSLLITDPDAVNFLDTLEESERAAAISRAVHFGLLALRDFGTVSKMDWVDKRFQFFEAEIQAAFDEAKRSLEEYLGEKGELQRAFSDIDSPLRSVLDPYSEGSPFWDLRHDLENEIKELRDAVMRESGRAEEAEVGTRKGGEFEEELYDFLQPICSELGDSIKRIGTDKVGSRKVGDLLIEVNEKHLQKPLKIVVEAKAARTTIGGKSGLLKQLTDSLDARKAQFSIGVVKTRDGLGGVHGCFAHIKPDKVLCTFEPDGASVELAYRFARAEALLRAMGESILDAATCASVSSRLAEIRTKLSGLSSAKTHLTTINKSTSAIRTMIETLQTDIGSILADIDQLIRNAPTPIKKKTKKKSKK